MTNNKTSTMWLANLSIVDHAYIDDRGNVVGGSFNPSFLVSGKVDPTEQVVVDFSTIKKQIKQIIDDKETGFDHKLWFIDGFSNGTITEVDNDRIVITTPTATLGMPNNAIKRFRGTEYSSELVGAAMSQYVTAQLARDVHPSIEIEAVCNNTTDCHFPTPDHTASLFRYAHGLIAARNKYRQQ